MQWRRQRRITHVIGSSNHVLLLARYQDAPPGEEDEEEGLRNGYVKDQDNDTSGHSFNRNGQGTYKSKRTGNVGGSGYAGGTRSHKEDSSGSPSQPKIIFNEDEYAKITTPRQDMLFKKGYLSRRKLWASNASTSATPSTTESQSASHSTAGRGIDGSETTEDQLLDRDYSTGEYPPMMKSGAHVTYGRFYDHNSGYYYEYPVMLLGPAPVPAQVGPNILAAVPCDPVPLRPIEWINPAFMPKLPGQHYCMMDYQSEQSTKDSTLAMEQDSTLLPVENTNGMCNESGTWSASCSESVAGETEKQPAEIDAATKDQTDEHQMEEQMEYQVEEQPLENGFNGEQYLEPVLMQQPMHVSHVIPVPQPYMYPGHYMFGPPLVNLNGVTIQGGPMIRITGVAAMSTTYTNRKKKKKGRNQRRLAVGNTEDEEEAEYSSEYDTGVLSSRLSRTACSTSTTATNRPLNPQSQEFQLQPVKLDASTSATPTSATSSTSGEGSAMNQSSTLSSETASIDQNEKTCNGVDCDNQKQEDEQLTDSNSDQASGSLSEKNEPTLHDADPDTETNGLTCCLAEKNDILPVDELVEVESPCVKEAASANESRERLTDEAMNGVEETLVNGKLNSSNEIMLTKSSSSCNDEKTSKTVPKEELENHESLSNIKLPKRKYSAKGTKFVREPTPGPDLDNTAEQPENAPTNEKAMNDLTQSLNGVNLSNDSSLKTESTLDSSDKIDVSSNFASENASNHRSKDDHVEAMNEDSGFESQTRVSDFPITKAVTEWLRRANSPDVFITNVSNTDNETEDEDEVDEQPPKNLQGNPMPALSANSGADNAVLSRATSYGEFARISNVKGQEQEASNGGLRKKRDAKKRSGERRRVRHVEGKLENEAMSSSDSCGQREVPANAARRKNNPTKQQDVGDVCEFTETDSVAGMRVASSSRMTDSKRVNARRTKRQGRSGKDPAIIDTKIRRIDDVDDENDEGIVKDVVKTYEKGTIIVLDDGKLLTTSRNDAFTTEKTTSNDGARETANKTESKRRNDDEKGRRMNSLSSIEEPDVLECWEAETIEPVITPKRMLQCRGVSCEGEAAEEDNIVAKKVNLDYVQKYYRLARGSATSAEEEITSKVNVDPSASKSVPNKSEQVEILTETGVQGEKNDIPIDEAFEIYESCYTGNDPFMGIDTKVFKSRTLYDQDGEGPIPCRGFCCNFQ
ncbi:uncharacterized protein LOC122396523 isoform X4 [Colletes gigas]|uniref:uncharacterized protein LOC122396523 isoform X4 n=1 Tax=Colletes gigas TaxID=935657 RepID=UPI001C9AAC96|nr:uncharacterized protein LOC122396523 isoform X4 [Colletes gigas]XP_043250965.1 uncharacterized protein LOC122396523 isoform X4 [Colletes gigas]